jgi:hypothetical protein
VELYLLNERPLGSSSLTKVEKEELLAGNLLVASTEGAKVPLAGVACSSV